MDVLLLQVFGTNDGFHGARAMTHEVEISDMLSLYGNSFV